MSAATRDATLTTRATAAAGTAVTALFRSAVVWTALGLLGGLVYRELTRSQGFTGRTQLAFVHTHALALGTTVALVLLALALVLRLDAVRSFRWGIRVWNVGLAVTTGMLAVKGTLQVLDPAVADSKALAGIAGLGHMTLTAAFILLLLGLRAGLRDHQARLAGAPTQDTTLAAATPRP